MSNQKQDSTENQYLDKLLEGVLTELPLENDVVREITPCRKAMNCVIIGLALSTFTLNFLGLNYILPAIGIVPMLLGFRSLRWENHGFKACWIISIIRSVYIFLWLIMNASVWQKTILESHIFKTFNYIQIGILLLLIICLRAGFSSVQKKAGIKQNTVSITVLILWFILLYGFREYLGSGWDSVVVFLILYALLIPGLYSLSSELDDAGYVIVAAPVRISDKAVMLGISIVLALGLATAYIFFSKYPMQWTPVSAASKDEAQAVKSHLMTLGAPATVVEDLTEEDLLDCTDAVRVIVQENDHLMDRHDLRIINIAVELPGSHEARKIINHFQWNVEVPFCGTEAIQFGPEYRDYREWRMEGIPSGRVLYDDGKTYTAPFYSIGRYTHVSDTLFWGKSVYNFPFAVAEFSFPNGKENYRGYVSYKVVDNNDGQDDDSWINYVHQKSWLQYPVQTAMDYKLGLSETSYFDVFNIVHDELQLP